MSSPPPSPSSPSSPRRRRVRIVSPKDLSKTWVKAIIQEALDKHKEEQEKQEQKPGIILEFISSMKDLFKTKEQTIVDRILKIVGHVASESYVDDTRILETDEGKGFERVLVFKICYPNRISRHQIDDIAIILGVTDITLSRGTEKGEIHVTVYISDDPICVAHRLREQALVESTTNTPPLSAVKCSQNTQVIYNAVSKHLHIDLEPGAAPIPIEISRTKDGYPLHCSYMPLGGKINLSRLKGLFSLMILHDVSFGPLDGDTKIAMFFEMYASFTQSS